MAVVPGAAVQVSVSVPGPELRRVLRKRDLVMLVIGTVIGSGIFLVPGAVLRPLGGSVSLALLVWTTGGVVSLLGALTYGELSAWHPEAGGLYIFIRDCFGPFLAFLYGWTLFFVISSGSVATLAVAFSNYFSEFLPLSPVVAKLVSVAMIFVIAIVNVRGTRESADLQNVTTAVKVLVIVAMAGALLWFGKNPAFLRKLGPLCGSHLFAALGFWSGNDQRAVGVRRLAIRNFQRRRVHQPAARFPDRILSWLRIIDRYLPARELGVSGGSRFDRCRRLQSCRSHRSGLGWESVPWSHCWLGNSRFYLPRRKLYNFDFAPRLLRNGKRWNFLPTLGPRTSSLWYASLCSSGGSDRVCCARIEWNL
jgi:hypothetical protein